MLTLDHFTSWQVISRSDRSLIVNRVESRKGHKLLPTMVKLEDQDEGHDPSFRPDFGPFVWIPGSLMCMGMLALLSIMLVLYGGD